MILYTSGSTGAPKGAMWTERMLCRLWTSGFTGDTQCAGHHRELHAAEPPRRADRACRRPSRQAAPATSSPRATCRRCSRTGAGAPHATGPRAARRGHALPALPEPRRPTGRARDRAPRPPTRPPRPNCASRCSVAGYWAGSSAPHRCPPEMRTFIESCLEAPRHRCLRPHRDRRVSPRRRHHSTSGDRLQARRRARARVLQHRPAAPPWRAAGQDATATPGYYKRPEVTAEVFDADGYYRTGDVMAEIAPDHLVYVDRRNNVIKLAQGEFVAVANLEAIYAGAALVRQIFVYGNSERSSLLAVVVPTDEAPWRATPTSTNLKAALRESLRATARSRRTAVLRAARRLPDRDRAVHRRQRAALRGGKAVAAQAQRALRRRLEQLYADLAARPLRANCAQLARDRRRATGHRHRRPGRPGAARVCPAAPDGRRPLHRPRRRLAVRADLLQPPRELFGVEVPVGVIIGPSADLSSLADYIESERAIGGIAPLPRPCTDRRRHPIDAADLTLDKFLDEDTLKAAASAAPVSHRVRTVLLTGANGYLGRFLTLEWLHRLSHTGGRLIALMRGDDAGVCTPAARAGLRQRRFPPCWPSSAHWPRCISRSFSATSPNQASVSMTRPGSGWRARSTSSCIRRHWSTTCCPTDNCSAPTSLAPPR